MKKCIYRFKISPNKAFYDTIIKAVKFKIL